MSVSYSAVAKQAVGIWELIACVLGVPLNLFALCLTVQLLKSFNQCNNRWFILSMCVADLLFVGVHSPLLYARFYLELSFNGFFCHLMFLTSHLSSVASSLSLLWLNFDKFLYLHKPLHYHVLFSKRRAICSVVFSWLVSLGWACLFVLGPFDSLRSDCNVRISNAHLWLYVGFAVLFFVFPTFFSLLISVYIVTLASRARRREEAERRANRADNPDWMRSSIASRWRTITFVFTTTIWSAGTYLPYRLVYIAQQLGQVPRGDVQVAIYLLLMGLLAANAVGNPIITIMTQSVYRNKVRQLFHCVSVRRNRLRNGSSSFSSVSVIQLNRV